MNWKHINIKIISWIPSFFLIITIFYLSSKNIKNDLITFKYFDKVAHFSIYALLSASFFIPLSIGKNIKNRKFWDSVVIKSILLTSLFGITDEIHQYFVPSRSCDIYDWIADTLGAIFSLIVIKLFIKIRYSNKV